MNTCDHPGCRTQLHYPTIRRITKCRRHRAEQAASVVPSQRTKGDVEALIADTESRIKVLESQLKSHKTALSEFPVEVGPAELARLLNRDDELRAIETFIAPCLNPHHNQSGATTPAGRLLYWLQSSSVLMGRRF